MRTLRWLCAPGAAWLLSLLLILPAPADAAVATTSADCALPPPLQLSQDPQWIDEDLEVLFDPQRRLRPEQVASAPLCHQFRPVDGGAGFGVEPRGVWLRLRLPPLPTNEAWRLLVPFSAIERVCVHWPEPQGHYRSECGDVRQPLGRGVRARQGWNFRIPAVLDASRPVLLYAQGDRIVAAHPVLGSADALTQHVHNRQTLLGAYCGVMLALALCGLAMYVAQRERVYWTFAAYFLVGMLYYAVQGGYLSSLGLVGRITIWFEWPLAALGMLCTTLFFQTFLDTLTYTPRLHRLTLLLMVPFMATAIAVPLFPAWLFARLSVVTFLPYLVVLIAMMVVRLRQGLLAAGYVLLAYALQVAGGMLKRQEHHGLLISAQTSDLVIFLGHFLTSGLLVAGLVARMRRLAGERDRARELASSNQQLALYRAHFDPVTHLPNRVKFREHLHDCLTRRTPGERYALVTLGLDRFGLLNDAMGHDIGDSVLCEIARRLQRALPPETLLARIGADLFAWFVCMPTGGDSIDTLRRHCESLQDAVTVPLRLASGARLSASIGIALCPDHASSAELLLQYSDAALHRAKLQGPGRLQLFDAAMLHSASRHLELHKALHRALEQGELSLHYQPIVSLADGELLGVEALLRWRRDNGQELPPDAFLPLLQSGDLLRPFSEWALRCYGRQLADWRARGVPIPYASFNLSAQQLHLPDIDQLILDVLRETGAPAECVTLEVTEGSLLDSLEATARLLGRLRQQGITVAVDDFGVGYASPHYLRMLPVDIVKLDGVFLRGVPQQADANAVLDGLITLGHSLQLSIVAECIETEAQALYLGSRGVRGGQGFWFSPALPAEELERWLLHRSVRAVA